MWCGGTGQVSSEEKKSPFLGGFRKEFPSLLLLLLFRVSLASSSQDSQCHLPPYLNLTFTSAYLYSRTKPWQVTAVSTVNSETGSSVPVNIHFRIVKITCTVFNRFLLPISLLCSFLFILPLLNSFLSTFSLIYSLLFKIPLLYSLLLTFPLLYSLLFTFSLLYYFLFTFP